MSQPSTKTDANARDRFSAGRKTEAVFWLLRGEDLASLLRELGIVAVTLSARRASLLDGGTTAMRSRPADDRDEVIARHQAKVGQLTMDVELLGRKYQHPGAGRPSVSKR